MKNKWLTEVTVEALIVMRMFNINVLNVTCHKGAFIVSGSLISRHSRIKRAPNVPDAGWFQSPDLFSWIFNMFLKTKPVIPQRDWMYTNIGLNDCTRIGARSFSLLQVYYLKRSWNSPVVPLNPPSHDSQWPGFHHCLTLHRLFTVKWYPDLSVNHGLRNTRSSVHSMRCMLNIALRKKPMTVLSTE